MAILGSGVVVWGSNTKLSRQVCSYLAEGNSLTEGVTLGH